MVPQAGPHCARSFDFLIILFYVVDYSTPHILCIVRTPQLSSEKEHLLVALVVPRTNDDVKIIMASSSLGNNNDDFNNENESSKKKQTVCVIGAGISGLSAAYLLHQSNAFAVTVYESEPTAGGHALTREKSKHAGELDVDLGF